MTREIPDHVKAYGKSPIFSAQTVPAKLLDYHDVKSGTWGRLNVQAGEVRYFVVGNEEPLATLHAGEFWAILPEEKHYIQVSEDTVFFVEFCK